MKQDEPLIKLLIAILVNTFMVILFVLLAGQAKGQSKLSLSGLLSGTYIADTICVQNGYGSDVKLCASVAIIDTAEFDLLEVDNNCPEACVDNFNPGIWVWGDSCIDDDEWIIDGWDGAIQDSADFWSQGFLDFIGNIFGPGVGVFGYDDCLLDTFEVIAVDIQPPGGIDRPAGPDGVREFYITFRAIDATGKTTTEDLLFRRTYDFYCGKLSDSYLGVDGAGNILRYRGNYNAYPIFDDGGHGKPKVDTLLYFHKDDLFFTSPGPDSLHIIEGTKIK